MCVVGVLCVWSNDVADRYGTPYFGRSAGRSGVGTLDTLRSTNLILCSDLHASCSNHTGCGEKKTVNSSTAGPNYKPTKHLDSLSLAKHTQSWRRLYKLKRIHYNEEGQSCFQRWTFVQCIVENIMQPYFTSFVAYVQPRLITRR